MCFCWLEYCLFIPRRGTWNMQYIVCLFSCLFVCWPVLTRHILFIAFVDILMTICSSRHTFLFVCSTAFVDRLMVLYSSRYICLFVCQQMYCFYKNKSFNCLVDKLMVISNYRHICWVACTWCIVFLITYVDKCVILCSRICLFTDGCTVLQ